MKRDLLAFIVSWALIIAGSSLSIGQEGFILPLMFWLAVPLVVPFIDMIINRVGVRDLWTRLGVAAPWILAAMLVTPLFGLALMGTTGLIVGSLGGGYIGIVMFCFWASYPPQKSQ